MSAPVQFVLAVAGGSGSGKSSVVRGLTHRFGGGNTVTLDQDSYYLTMGGGTGNFDAPEAIDHALLAEQLKRLRTGASVMKPRYDFATHQRMPASIAVAPAQVLVLEGLFAYWDPDVKALCDFSVYIDAAADLRFIRRLQRDIAERSRSVESVVSQYMQSVRPMHERYAPLMRDKADLIISNNESLEDAVDLLEKQIRQRLQGR